MKKIMSSFIFVFMIGQMTFSQCILSGTPLPAPIPNTWPVNNYSFPLLLMNYYGSGLTTNPGPGLNDVALATNNLWISVLNSQIATFYQIDGADLGTDASGNTILASTQCLFSSYPGNFTLSGAQPPIPQNVDYPTALAEKLSNSQLDGPGGPLPVFTITINNTVSWYTGRDGNAPAGQVDLETVLIHEIAHGLGLCTYLTSGSSGVTISNQGSANNLTVYDYYMNCAGNATNPSYPSEVANVSFPSTAFSAYTQGTDGSVVFTGSSATSLNNGTSPEVFTPNPWANDQSWVNLDPTSFPNALQKPFVATGPGNHQIDPLVVAMLNDIGWATVYPTGVGSNQAAITAMQYESGNSGPETTLSPTPTRFNPGDAIPFSWINSWYSGDNASPSSGSWEIDLIGSDGTLSPIVIVNNAAVMDNLLDVGTTLPTSLPQGTWRRQSDGSVMAFVNLNLGWTDGTYTQSTLIIGIYDIPDVPTLSMQGYAVPPYNTATLGFYANGATSYNIYYYQADWNQPLEINVPAGQSEYTVTNLSGTQNTYFYVTGVNSAGEGQASNQVTYDPSFNPALSNLKVKIYGLDTSAYSQFTDLTGIPIALSTLSHIRVYDMMGIKRADQIIAPNTSLTSAALAQPQTGLYNVVVSDVNENILNTATVLLQTGN